MQKEQTKIKIEGQTWSLQHMPMAISANLAVLAALGMIYDAATTPNRSVDKHWWCFEENIMSPTRRDNAISSSRLSRFCKQK